MIFRCPGWMCQSKWHVLFQEAFALGQKLQWDESIQQVEDLDWPPEVDEETLINYQWAITCAKLTWSFSAAAASALLWIPEGYSNLKEIQYVVDLANHRKIKGISLKTQKRKLQQKAERSCEALRKLHKKEGRLEELLRRLKRRNFGSETVNLWKKIYPDSSFDYRGVNRVSSDLQELHGRIVQKEAADKDFNISSWKKRMQNGTKDRGSWINKQGHLHTPTVRNGRDAVSRQDGAAMIHQYWVELWNNQKWEEEERSTKVQQMVDIIKQKTSGVSFLGSRPDLASFQAALRRISGTHGIDGWSHHELRAIASSEDIAGMLWEEMEMWEQTTLIPASVAACKLVCIPKKDLRHLAPKDFRPICVMSALWRAWSSAWIRSSPASKWMSCLFPLNISGGIPGSLGAETLSAMVDHQLHQHHYGISLDFKHAFDTVDLELLHRTMVQTVPDSMVGWADLIFKQWKCMQRFIIYDCCTHSVPIVSTTGLPQGDPASPLAMNILMMCCQDIISRQCNDPSYFFVNYMDDRTVIADDPGKIKRVEEAWSATAASFHLIENKDKTQHVVLAEKQCMEVLGALVGSPSPHQDANSKASARLRQSALKFRRISFLPLRHREKLLTANLFGRSGLEYGWVSSSPSKNQCKLQESWLWRCLGRARYASPYMRKVILGGHSYLQITLLCRQLRLVAKRNEALRSLQLPIGRAPLDDLVEQGLTNLGWTLRGSEWHHPRYGRFSIANLVDDKVWGSVHHNIRESYREIAFHELVNSGRHDAMEINTEYSPDRRKLALKWAGANFQPFLMVVGGLQSPLQRAILGYNTSVRPKCGINAPSWDHLWQCAVGFTPSDGLMRRFLWPRCKQDFGVCSAFLKAFLSTGC